MESTIVEKIKEKLQIVAPDTYQKWKESQFDIDHMFIITNQIPLVNLTLLNITAKLGNSKMAGFLIEKGADLNQKDNNGNSPLCLAAGNDYKETVEVPVKNYKNLQLIYEAYGIRLLSDHKVVKGINSMRDKKLKILCKHNNKFTYKGIEKLLSDEDVVNNINDYDDEAFKGILNKGMLEVLGVKEVHKSDDELESSDDSDDERSEEDHKFESSDDKENKEDHENCYNFDYEEDEKMIRIAVL